MFKFKSAAKQFETEKLPLNKRIHPGIKFLTFIAIIIFVFLMNSLFTQLLFSSFLLIIYSLCKIRRKTFMLIIKSFIIMFIIFVVINWFFYKDPIAFSIKDFNLIGGHNILNSYDWYSNNGEIYISNIWGGEIVNGVSQEMVKHFVDTKMSSINKWIEMNNVNISKLTNAPSWLTTNDDKKAFLYLINNKFVFDGVKYNFVQIKSLVNSGSIIYDPAYSLLYRSHWYTFSPNAIIQATYISTKILCILLASSMLTETTNSIELSSGLETIFSPLKIIRFPVNEAATIIAIAIRFIPSLLSESKRILNAQASRGVDFKNGNIGIKIKALVSLIVPLFSIAFRNSEELANAMDARGYNPKGVRTKYRVYHFSFYDFSLIFLVCLFGVFGTLFHYMDIFFTPFGMVEGGLVL